MGEKIHSLNKIKSANTVEPNKWETNVLKTLPLSLKLMAEVNRLFKIQNIFKTGAFTFRFETILWSSCLSHLTLLVCLTSLFLSVSPHSSCLSHLTLLVCLTSLILSVSPHSSCLSHLALLVSQRDSLSSRDKLNLICDARLSFSVLHWAAAFSFNCSVL